MNKKGTAVESLSLLIGFISLFLSGVYLLSHIELITFTFLDTIKNQTITLLFAILVLLNSVVLVISTIGRVTLGGVFGRR